MSQQVEQTSKITLDQLQYFWMPSGLPCFVADRDNICDIVEDFGFNIYYLLANKKTVKTIPNNTTKTTTTTGYSNGATTYNYSNTQPAQVVTYNSSLFKVINNFVREFGVAVIVLEIIVRNLLSTSKWKIQILSLQMILILEICINLSYFTS